MAFVASVSPGPCGRVSSRGWVSSGPAGQMCNSLLSGVPTVAPRTLSNQRPVSPCRSVSPDGRASVVPGFGAPLTGLAGLPVRMAGGRMERSASPDCRGAMPWGSQPFAVGPLAPPFNDRANSFEHPHTAPWAFQPPFLPSERQRSITPDRRGAWLSTPPVGMGGMLPLAALQTERRSISPDRRVTPSNHPSSQLAPVLGQPPLSVDRCRRSVTPDARAPVNEIPWASQSRPRSPTSTMRRSMMPLCASGAPLRTVRPPQRSLTPDGRAEGNTTETIGSTVFFAPPTTNLHSRDTAPLMRGGPQTHACRLSSGIGMADGFLMPDHGGNQQLHSAIQQSASTAPNPRHSENFPRTPCQGSRQRLQQHVHGVGGCAERLPSFGRGSAIQRQRSPTPLHKHAENAKIRSTTPMRKSESLQQQQGGANVVCSTNATSGANNVSHHISVTTANIYGNRAQLHTQTDSAAPVTHLEVKVSGQSDQVSQAPNPHAVTTATSRQVSVPLLPSAADLQHGAWVQIGDCICMVKNPLGMGSFGAVWAAEQVSSPNLLAIKEIICSSQADLLNALFEGHLLRTLIDGIAAPGQEMRDMADSLGAPNRSNTVAGTRGTLPMLVACDTKELGQECWRIRLAMTRIPGEPLDAFLLAQQRQQERSARDGRLNVSRKEVAVAAQFMEACHMARQLLVQLVPTFQHIATVAYHRDVNAHNILVDKGADEVPHYGLVDFGLAVDAVCWQQGDASKSAPPRPSRVGQDGACTWHHLDVGGDCRYWPVSAWVQFLLGWTELEARPTLAFEYQTQLDLHSLGLTALQVLAELMPAELTGAHDLAVAELCAVKGAWERYWSMVSPLHDRLMDTFHGGGDWDALKVDCLDSRVHQVIAEHLHALRSTICAAGEACKRAPPETCAAGIGGLLAALLLLISSGTSHEEKGQGPDRWRQVAQKLCADDPESSGQVSGGQGRCHFKIAGACEKHDKGPMTENRVAVLTS